MRLIMINRLVLEISACFALAGAQRITSTTTGENAYLLLDWEEMDRVFRALAGSALMERRPAPAVRGTWLPIGTGNKYKKRGCALVSISFTEKRPATRFAVVTKMAGDASFRDLSGLHDTIERHHGILQVVRQQGEVGISIYLPVLDRH